MMKKEDFKVGEEVQFTIYSYDDKGTEYTDEIQGVVCQVTNDFVVIDNGKYKESYTYHQMVRNKVEGKAKDIYFSTEYDDALDVIADCIKVIESGKMGYVFSDKQFDEVMDRLTKESEINGASQKYKIKRDDGIIGIKKIQ